jgi:NTE family protein
MFPKVALVLSGGVALGAYQAGAYAALHASPTLWPAHISGSSVGAVNGAIIASNPPHLRLRALQTFWRGMASDRYWPSAGWVAQAPGQYRRAYRWLQALQTRVWGCPGVFRPRSLLCFQPGLSFYDLSPFKARLERELDFDRLAESPVRLTVTTTDVETGEAIVFDTARGDRIGPEHLIASCGFLPDFPPVEIGGRLLGDGGLAANAPIETAVDDDANRADDLLCFVVDLFATVGPRPTTLEQAIVRSLDLLFGNQTARALRAFERAETLRRLTNRDGGRVTLLPVFYSGGPDEPGPQKLFDFSTAALAERWETGHAAMRAAIAGLDERRRRPAAPPAIDREAGRDV